jgi:hypothetical protein
MADFPFNHILAAGITDLQVGAALRTAEDLQPRSFVCFLRNNNMEKGYFFLNGSNGRVKTVRGGVVTNTTLKSGNFVISCADIVTNKRFADNWTVADLQPPQINAAADVLLLQELRAVHDLRFAIEDIVMGLEQLTVEELVNVREYMRTLREG